MQPNKYGSLTFQILFENLCIEDKKSTLFPLRHSWWRITRPKIAAQTTTLRKRYMEREKKTAISELK